MWLVQQLMEALRVLRERQGEEGQDVTLVATHQGMQVKVREM